MLTNLNTLFLLFAFSFLLGLLIGLSFAASAVEKSLPQQKSPDVAENNTEACRL